MSHPHKQILYRLSSILYRHRIVHSNVSFVVPVDYSVITEFHIEHSTAIIIASEFLQSVKIRNKFTQYAVVMIRCCYDQNLHIIDRSLGPGTID